METSFEPEDIYRQVVVEDVTGSSDRTRIVMSATRTSGRHGYSSELFLIDPEGTGLRPLLASNGPLSRPRLSPDGLKLSHLSTDRSGSRILNVTRVPSGELEQQIRLPGSISRADWSPDSERILVIGASGSDRFGDEDVALTTRSLTWHRDGTGVRSQFSSLWVTNIEGHGLRRLTSPDFEVFSATWIDDDTIAFVADRGPNAHVDELPQLWRIRATGGDPEQLARLSGRVAEVSSDGNGNIAFSGIDEPGAPLWAPFNAYRLIGTATQQVGRNLGRRIGNATSSDLIEGLHNFSPRLVWTVSGELLTTSSSGGSSHLTSIRQDGSGSVLTSGERVTTSALDVPSGLLHVSTEDGSPPELRLVDGGQSRTLTNFSAQWLRSAPIAPEHVELRSSVDGSPFDAWLIRATRPSHGRTVLHIHGGPYAAHGAAQWTEMMVLAAAGVNVLYINPPGSVGYPNEFTQRLIGRWGEADVPWFIDAIDWAVDTGVADRARVGVMGLSYGGMAVLSLLSSAPDRFKAAVCEGPVAHVPSYQGTCDLGTGMGGLGLGVYPSDLGRQIDTSFGLRLGSQTPPTLVIAAENDLRCQPGQADLVFSRLKQAGVTTRMVRYPEESHRLCAAGRPDRRVDRLHQIRSWLLAHI